MLNLTSLRRLALAAGLPLLLGAGLAFGGDEAVAPDRVIELPKFTVTDSRILPPPEPWRYARLEGFEVLSNASDREAARLLRQFLRFHQALVTAWPPAEFPSAVPTALILCGQGGKFDAFKPKQSAGPQSGLVSLSLRDREMSAIVVDLEATTLRLMTPEGRDAANAASATAAAADAANAAAGPGTDLIAIDPRAGAVPPMLIEHNKQLYREYIRFVLSRIEPRAPAWLEEGLSQLLMRMEFTSTSIAIGNLDEPNRVSAIPGVIEDRDFNTMLAERGLLPLAEVFSVAHDSPVALNPVGSVWAKECYALVHYCLYGNKGRLQQAFVNFATRTSSEPVTETMFKECFGCSYRSMLIDLRSYIGYTTYTTTELHTRKGQTLPEPPKIEFRDATEAEVGRIKGDVLRMAGNAEAARAALLAPYLRDERDPRLLAALGLYERAAGDETRARKLLEAAVRAGVVRPRAYLELARLRYADALAHPDESNGRFSPVQVAGILHPLFTARIQPPPLPEVYELIAATWARSAVAPTREHLAVVAEGVRSFLHHAGFVYQAAELHAQFGFNQEAAALADLGSRMTNDAAMKARFASLKASLPSLPPVTAPAPGRR